MQQLSPLDRVNFGLPQTCIATYICWKILSLGQYVMICQDCATHILLQTESSARAWIDALLFRASAMLSPNKRMVLNMEHIVPATTINPSSMSTLSGFVDYTAVVASQRVAGKSPLVYLYCQAHCFLQVFFSDHRNFVSSSHMCYLASLL